MPTLLLHGLGAAGAVWRRFDGLAPDLPGHGTAAWAPPYTFERHAEALVPTLPDEPVTVIGHSMGGVVGLVLATMAPDRVAQVVAVGVKVTWSEDDLARTRALAAKPPRTFPSRAEAVERFLKISGLAGVIGAEDPMADSGVVAQDGQWRLAQDPRTFGVGVPDMPRLLQEINCPVTLARGEHDSLVTHAELAQLVSEPVTLPNLGHNAHIEDPGALLRLVQ